MYNIIITMDLIGNMDKHKLFFLILFILSIIIIFVLYYILNNEQHGEKKDNKDDTHILKGNINQSGYSDYLIEGFNINDVGKIIDDVKKINNVANSVTREIQGLGREVTKSVGQIERTATNVTNQIDNKLDRFGKTLETKVLREVNNMNKTLKNQLITQVGDMIKVLRTQVIEQVLTMIKTLKTQLIKQMQNMIEILRTEVIEQVQNMIRKLRTEVFSRITAIFKQIPQVLNDAIVKPLITLFKGIGNIFIQIFEILKKIGYKMVSLPGCILYYLINGIVNSIVGFLTWITPSFIANPVSAIWNATFGAIISWFLDGIGYTDGSRKCYAFNVNEEVSGMNDELKNIQKAFTKDFGKNIEFKI